MHSFDEKPKFTIGDTDIMIIDEQINYINLRVNITCWEYELQSDHIKTKVRNSVNFVLNYLIQEDYLKSVTGWKVEVNVFGHPPTESNNN